MKLFHRLRVPRNFRARARARRSFFVVKFHANLFNGLLAIANKRGDELFAACIYARNTYVCIATTAHVRRTRARSYASLRGAFVTHSSEKYKINIVSDPRAAPPSLSLFPIPFAAIIARY